MEFTNEFTIPVGLDEAFAVLTDLERVAPCMPGATLEEVEGDTYSGRVKVKVGPMSLTYGGTATLVDVDPASHTATIRATGREQRGAGTAAADVTARLAPDGDQTVVSVTTDITVTGKPAQFGRGVMADVGARIIDRFAANLREELVSGDLAAPVPEAADAAPAGADGETTTAPTSPAVPPSGPRRVEHRPPKDEALDVGAIAFKATPKRVLALVAAVGVVVALLVRRRGRR